MKQYQFRVLLPCIHVVPFFLFFVTLPLKHPDSSIGAPARMPSPNPYSDGSVKLTRRGFMGGYVQH